jgi:Arc/MetJ family transcription regulator
MKMTLHIDDALLARVMKATGTTSKTRAVDFALREMDRRAHLAALCAEGLGMGAAELREAVDSSYDLQAQRERETPVSYGRKPHSR